VPPRRHEERFYPVHKAFACRGFDSNTLPMLQGIARLILKAGGWTPVGELPTADKVVFVAAPHTTNWDGFWLLVYKIALDVEVHFLAKHTLFWWPLGPVLRALGAMPIDRSISASTVQQVVDVFAERDKFWFALAPEGTRKWQLVCVSARGNAKVATVLEDRLLPGRQICKRATRASIHRL